MRGHKKHYIGYNQNTELIFLDSESSYYHRVALCSVALSYPESMTQSYDSQSTIALGLLRGQALCFPGTCKQFQRCYETLQPILQIHLLALCSATSDEVSRRPSWSRRLPSSLCAQVSESHHGIPCRQRGAAA